eukprot:909618-Rhodomonas_salina.6
MEAWRQNEASAPAGRSAAGMKSGANDTPPPLLTSPGTCNTLPGSHSPGHIPGPKILNPDPRVAFP